MKIRIVLCAAFIGIMLVGCSDSDKAPAVAQAVAQAAPQQHAVDESQHETESQSDSLNQIKLHSMDFEIALTKIETGLRRKAYAEVAEHAAKIASLATKIRSEVVTLPNSDMPLYLSTEMIQAAESLEHDAGAMDDAESHHGLEELKRLLSTLKEKLNI
jgi:hypothetical protein